MLEKYFSGKKQSDTGVVCFIKITDQILSSEMRKVKRYQVSPVESYNLTDLFTISELSDPSHDVSKRYKIRQSPDLEALKLRKGWSGSDFFYFHIFLGGTSKINIFGLV